MRGGGGYVYSNANDPGAEAQAREEAEKAYRAAMAEKEEGFMRYMMMQQEIAKEKQRAEEAARQEMEDLLVGRGNAGQQGQLGATVTMAGPTVATMRTRGVNRVVGDQ